MWDVDLDHCRRLALSDAADVDFSFGGASLQICTEEGQNFQGSGTAIAAGTTNACTENVVGAVDCEPDKIAVSDEDSLRNNANGIDEGQDRSHLTLENCASMDDFKNGGETLSSARKESDLGVEKEAGKLFSAEVDLAEAINKSCEVERDLPCLSPPRIMLGCIGLRNSSHGTHESGGGGYHSAENNANIQPSKTEPNEPSQVVQLQNSVDNNSSVHATMEECAGNLDELPRGEAENIILLDEEKNVQVFHSKGMENDVVQVRFGDQMLLPLLAEGGSCTAGSCSLDVSSNCRTLESSSLHKSDPRSTSVGCSTAISFSEQLDNADKPEYISMVRRRNPARAASSGNSNQVPKSTSSRKKSKNTSTICPSLVEALRVTSSTTSHIVTKKRCRSLKRARISVWGGLGCLFELFKREEKTCNSRNKGPKKGRGRKRRRYPTNNRAGTSRASRVNQVGASKPKNLPEKVDHQFDGAPHQHGSLSLNSNDLNQSPTPENGSESKYETAGSFVRQSPCWPGHLENQTVALLCKKGTQNVDRDQESSLTQEASCENTLSDCHGIRSLAAKGEPVEVVDDTPLLDPSTSPDSGVVHPPMDGGNAEDECMKPASTESSSKGGIVGYHLCDLGSPVQENFHAENFRADAVTFSEADTSVSLQHSQQQACGKIEKRGANVNVQVDTKTGEYGCLLSGYSSEGTSLCPSDHNENEKPSKKSSGRRKKGSSSKRKKPSCKRITGKGPMVIGKLECRPGEHSSVGTTEGVCGKASCEKGVCNENPASSSMDRTNGDLESSTLQILSSISPDQLPKSKGRSIKDRAKDRKLVKATPARCRKQNGASQKKDVSKRSTSRGGSKRKTPHVQSTVMEVSQGNDPFQDQSGSTSLICEMDNCLSAGKPDESNGGFKEPDICDDEALAAGPNHVSGGQSLRERAAWVRCDDCYKWRSIAVELADTIDETGCRWTCKDNKDKAFADCSIRQEKTNAEINAELEISDASCEEDLCTERRFTSVSELKPPAVQQSAWVHIDSNIFLHRARKTQTIDEIMVCQCKPPRDGSLGCGDECLNRMLNIECTPETCPCGNLCSNQQFQKREYSNCKYFRCGKKGFGLKLLEDVKQGQFLIEYVGEVLDMAAHEARQREYAARGQKHFYFMTLNGNEVIDACAKGNLGRFINHSCAPNCRTEKWMVNGEVCVGLFATRDIKKEEEVTFDYNYVRVFGAAAKRCLCGSAECRGYIGGDPLNSEMLVHSDSDEEHPEPVMMSENGEISVELVGMTSESTDLVDPPKSSPRKTDDIAGPIADFSSASNDALPGLSVTNQPSEAMSLTSKEFDRVPPDPSLDVGKPSAPKSSRSSSEVKRSRCKTKKSTVHKEKRASVVVSHSQPATAAVCRSGHHEGVEDKLNELLDPRGGINKHRDATKGYLKLLFFSATSGDDAKSETSQSTRDLSLILDALLKTKSRTVLVDVINKNGLQMLHNIMKQNRRNFSKIPIIRKLLKVLDFLAVKEIITHEHMSFLPSNAEVESFRESIIRLTYHNDVQVHQMARNFRNRWLPRAIRKVNSSDRKRSMLPPHPRDRVDPTGDDGQAAAPPVPSPQVNPSRPRKRKSRWDQEGPSDASRSEAESTVSGAGSFTAESTAEEAPPGFGPPQPLIQTDLSAVRCSAVAGHPQQRYRAHLTVSYGIPLALAEQLGTAVDSGQGWSSQCQPRWTVAPGMPFHPFPPLPTAPRTENAGRADMEGGWAKR